MRKILLVIFMLFLVFIIYFLNRDTDIYVLSIGDYVVLNNSNFDSDIKNFFGKKLEKNVLYGNDGDYRVIDLINDINDNKKFISGGSEYTLNNSLIKADIIFISIGINDFNYNKSDNFDYVDEVLSDLDKLLSLVRKYCKERIVIFYYNLDNDKLTNYVNGRLDRLATKYDIDIIDFSDNYNVLNTKIINYLDNLY